MTNSHNRSGKNGGSHAERYFNNHSPQQVSGGGGKRNASNGNRGQKSPSSTYFRSISTSNAIPIVQSSTSPVSSKGGSYYSTSTPNGGRNHSFNLSTSYQRTSPGGGFNAMLAGSPPNFSHFAGSKCYDAPAPTALPKPPVHWTSSASSSSSSSTSTPTQVSAPNTSKTSTNVVGKPTTTTVKNASSTKGSSSSRSTKAKSVQKPAMSCAAAAAKATRNVDFATHSLKMILNVQA